MKLIFKETPYGFKEAEYNGYVITVSDGSYYPAGVSVEICGDVCMADTVEDAVKMIDEMEEGL